MSVHEQLISGWHEEPTRATVRDRRVWASRRRSFAVSRQDADTDRAPGWVTQALRFWVRSRQPCVPSGTRQAAFEFPNTSAAPPASGWRLAGKRAPDEQSGPYDVQPLAGSTR